jgi:hypothetical protein
VFAEERNDEAVAKNAWKALVSFFRADSRDKLAILLGFLKVGDCHSYR